MGNFNFDFKYELWEFEMMEKLLPEITAMLKIGGLKLITFTLFIYYVVCLFSDKLLFKY